MYSLKVRNKPSSFQLAVVCNLCISLQHKFSETVKKVAYYLVSVFNNPQKYTEDLADLGVQ